MTDRYAVIGNPVAHSKSPAIHAEFARQTQQDIVYERLLAPLDRFAETVGMFQQQGGKGLNVTLPFKLEAYVLATQCSKRAQAAQAVNTLRFEKKEIYADNTDGVGLVRDIKNNLGFAIQGKRVLLLGAGGAARGVILPLLQEQPGELAVVNRTLSKAKELQQHFAQEGTVNAWGYDELNGQSFDLVINSTSASVKNELPDLPRELFTKTALAYDMMYSKQLTLFLKFARENGATLVADGIGMLVEQAAESFFVWRGIKPDTKEVLVRMRGGNSKTR